MISTKIDIFINEKLSRTKGVKTSRIYNCSILKTAPFSHLLCIKIQR